MSDEVSEISEVSEVSLTVDPQPNSEVNMSDEVSEISEVSEDSFTVNDEKYISVKKLSEGSVCEIYLAKDENETEVAIKIEKQGSSKDSPVLAESAVYMVLNDEIPGIPRYISSGTENDRNALVMEALGPDLQTLLESCGGKFSLKTVLMLADQMIRRVQGLHSKGFIHQDIKPSHFAMGLGDNSNTVYLIDFGIAKRYMDPVTKAHEPCAINEIDPVGTLRYASRANDRGATLSRRDDMESLGYVFVHFLKGELPWDSVPESTPGIERQMITDMKRTTLAETLCQGLPKEFAHYMLYCRQLTFPKTPDYANLRTSFAGLMSRSDMEMDYEYDWIARQNL